MSENSDDNIVFGNYNVDFYSPSVTLVIELDGQHYFTPEGIIKDNERDDHLEMMKLTELRFKNEDVLNKLILVLIEIKTHFMNTKP